MKTDIVLSEELSHLTESGRLREAFELVRNEASQNSDWKVIDKLNKLEETYKYMIHYMVEGIEDKGRETLYSSIVENLHDILGEIIVARLDKDSPMLTSETRRLARMRGETIKSLADKWKSADTVFSLALEADSINQDIRKERESALESLFALITAMTVPTKEDISVIKKLLDDLDSPFDLKCIVIAALTVSLLEYYHSKKLTILADVVERSDNDRIVARALTGVILTLAIHPNRARKDKRLSTRFMLWEENIILYTKLKDIIINVLRTIDTERVTRKMKEEIIPELIKLQPEFSKRIKGLNEEEAVSAFEENPEWKELFDKSGLNSKLKELDEMQVEGADLMMASFENLKFFPFFSTMANWFLPFSFEHSSIADNPLFQNQSLRDLISVEGMMCESDKFSLAFSLNRVDEAQRNMITSQIDGSMAQFKEMMKDSEIKNKFPVFATEVSKYMRDLYRFYKLFRRADNFVNPFAKPFPLLDIPFVSSLVRSEELLVIVSEFYFRRGYYELSLKFLDLLQEQNPTDRSVLEKKGYALQCLKRYQEAYEFYQRAELLGEPSLWLLRKLASVSRTLKRYKESVDYYRRALEKDPDNIMLTMGLGSVLVETGDLKEALSCFYKAEFLSPVRPDILRAVAWTEFLNRRFDKSEPYMLKLMAYNPFPNDYMNLGHLYFLKGDFKKSAEKYLEALNRFKSDILFDSALENDIPLLKEMGINEIELHLVIDHIKYSR